ncbi:hypothetical protein [Scopulibacillus darangshiensis]|nr:hypothetical protein [Scopulibacillus darangshiensis]
MEDRLKEIKENYSNAIDIALSDGGTLPSYDIDVADMNWLINCIEQQQKENDSLRWDLTRVRAIVGKSEYTNQTHSVYDIVQKALKRR